MTKRVDWQRVGHLFHAVLGLGVAERRAFLEQSCAGDEVVRAEVESLLAADASAPPWLEQPVYAVACQLLASEPETTVAGSHIGPYRIERELGRGGMGAVYLATRDDGQFRQQVAVKRIRGGLGGAVIARRFRDERQILADLAHPHIARLLDGGMGDDGQPYLVMEYIDGTPIDAYCDHQRLSLHRRIEIFLKVCAAVQHAHRQLVVHCDLKPGNILVSSDGEPKLLDFGIARLLANDGVSPGRTAAGSRRLTLAYASPEQILGHPVATASDVYSLGVLLYVLLTGTLPDRRAKVLVPPSAAVRERSAGERLSRRLRGDLDSIVLEALHREPLRRYGSVEQLAADLRRYRSGRPVLARRQTRTYRAGKLIRRHWLTVAAVAMVTLSLLVGSAVAWSQARKAQRQRHVAEQERGRAEQVTGFVESLFRQADPTLARGPDLTLAELLDDAVGQIRAGLSGQVEVQADLMQILGDGYRRLGLLDQARELLEQALVIRQRALGGQHPAVARSLDSLGLLYRWQGDLARAEIYIRRALALSRARLGDQHGDVAESLDNLGHVLLARGDPAAAEPHLRRALSIRRQLFGNRSREVSVSLNNLAMLLRDSRRAQEARALLEETLALRRQLFGERHLLVANSLHNLAVVLTDLGDLEPAERCEREAIAIYKERLGDDHRSTVGAQHSLGRLLRLDGRRDEARGAVEEAVRVNERRHNLVDLATNLMLLGALAFDDDDFTAAESLFKRTLELRREVLGVAHPSFANALFNLVRAQREQGGPSARARAEAALRSALGAWRTASPQRAGDAARAEGQLGLLLVGLGRRHEAAARLRAGIDGLARVRRPDLAAPFEEALATLLGRPGEQLLKSDPR